MSGYEGSPPESTFPKLICKKKDAFWFPCQSRKSAALCFLVLQIEKQSYTIQHHQIALPLMLQSTLDGDSVPVSKKSQLILLMHLQRVLNAKQPTKKIEIWRRKKKKPASATSRTKKLILVEHPFKEKKEERCVTEQYAQHKVQAVRLWRLINSGVGDNDETKKKKKRMRKGETTQFKNSHVISAAKTSWGIHQTLESGDSLNLWCQQMYNLDRVRQTKKKKIHNWPLGV